MGVFTKVVNDLKSLTIFAKRYITDVFGGPNAFNSDFSIIKNVSEQDIHVIF